MQDISCSSNNPRRSTTHWFGSWSALPRPNWSRSPGVCAKGSGAMADRVSGTAELPTTEDTIALGARLGGQLHAGDVVVLSGPLGAGKTVLAKGIAQAM